MTKTVEVTKRSWDRIAVLLLIVLLAAPSQCQKPVHPDDYRWEASE